MATPFHFELVTPERSLFSGECDEVSLRTDEGEISFLAHHEDFVAALDITVVRVHLAGSDGEGSDSDTALRFAVHGGFVHVDDEKVTILASVAEEASAIDVDRARRALEAAEERLRTPSSSSSTPEGEPDAPALTGAMLALLAPQSGEAALRRARVRLDAAGALSVT